MVEVLIRLIVLTPIAILAAIGIGFSVAYMADRPSHWHSILRNSYSDNQKKSE